jgi:hypothetical protein
MHVCKLHIWKYRFNMVKVTCLFPPVATQSLLVQSPGDSRTAGCLNNDKPETNNADN